MRRSTQMSLAALTAVTVLSACGDPASEDNGGVEPGDDPVEIPDDPDADGEDPGGGGEMDPGDTPGNGDDADNGDDAGFGDDFDRDDALEQAETLLGTPEQDVEEDAETRIVRRGDEDFPGTMDLRPGRQNVELDEVDGSVVVTRVSVEVPDGEDPIDVQLET